MFKLVVTSLVVFFLINPTLADDKQILENYIRSRVENIEYTGDMKCGTRYTFLLHQYWNQLSPEIQLLYKLQLLDPPVRERSLSTSHFTLHWDESSGHSVPLEDISGNGYPDFIDSAAVIFERVWEIEIDLMGFQPPLDEEGSPVETYDIVFSSLGGVYGQTWFEDFEDDITSIPGIQLISYIEMDNDYIGFDTPGLDGLKVTAAHEFHHAVQLCYNVWFEGNNAIDLYFFEMTSTWMEEVLYPEINDFYNYLPYLFQRVSNTPFNSFSGSYPYGNTLYLHMLEKKYGAEVVQLIWEEIKNRPSLDAIDHVLEEFSNDYSWSESLNEYGSWLYYTGDRAQADTYFNNADSFPQVRILSSDTLIFNKELHAGEEINELSNRYVKIKNIDGVDFTMSVSTNSPALGGFRELTTEMPYSFSNLNKSMNFNLNQSNSLVLLVTNADFTDKDFNISIGESKPAYSFPNPFSLQDGNNNYIRFMNIPEEGNIYIYDILGRQVTKLEIDNSASEVMWNLRTQNGTRVASGMYIFLAKGKRIEKTGKIVIIK